MEKALSQLSLDELQKQYLYYLTPKYIQIPSTEEEVQEMVVQFCKKHCFPQCLRSVDGTHIAIKRPTVTFSSNFINRKGDFT